MFGQLKEWVEDSHDYAREWKKRTGGKVVGYFCTYVPEEVMYAANILPVRILGGGKPESIADHHIFPMYCPFCRDCLAQGLKGKYDYLDGIVIAQSCLHIRQTYSSWKINIPVEFSHYLPMPSHVQSSRAVPYLAKEIQYFKQNLEKWLGREITEEAIKQAIEVYNLNRRLLRQIYETRKQEYPPLTGAEAMCMVLASQLVDKAEHNQVLSRILNNLNGRQGKPSPGVRLMLIGSENNDVDFVEMIESLNAIVVIDDHCTGSRYFWNESPADGDMYIRLAERYVRRPPCPSKDWPARTRSEHMKGLIKEYGVQGVIFIQQKFCDPHENDIPILKEALDELAIPNYMVEFDMSIPIGQFKIRLEAFIELFEQELPFS